MLREFLILKCNNHGAEAQSNTKKIFVKLSVLGLRGEYESP